MDEAAKKKMVALLIGALVTLLSIPIAIIGSCQG